MQTLYRLLPRQGLARFVQDTFSPLNHAVGEAWARGEWGYTRNNSTPKRGYGLCVTPKPPSPTAKVGRASCSPPYPKIPRQGILMVAAPDALESADCVSRGSQTPVAEIANAVKAQAIDVVALSFSIIYPPRRIPPALTELRQRLAPAVDRAGGAGTARLTRGPTGTRLLPTLEDALAALGEQRTRRPAIL